MEDTELTVARYELEMLLHVQQLISCHRAVSHAVERGATGLADDLRELRDSLATFSYLWPRA